MEGFERGDHGITGRVQSAAACCMGVLEKAVQAVVDFAAPDVCCSCGSKTGSPPASQRTLPPATRRLAAEAAVPLLGRLAVVNHPYCRPCLLRFEECVGPARIGEMGVCGGVGWVRTRDGAFFSPAGIANADGRSRARRMESVGLDVYSPFRMNDASLDLVRLIKFSRRRSLAPLASAAMAYALTAGPRVEREAILVPVPMHPSARRRRGFNQAEVLARGVAGVVGGTVRYALRKPARTSPQSQTSHRLRADNVRGAYRPAGEALGGRCVYLVDDLVTTGATAAACAATLMAAGAGEVAVLCLARTP